MGKAVVDAGGHEAELVTDIEAGDFEAFSKDALRLIQDIDSISELDLAACSRRLVLQHLKNFWSQQGAPDDDQIAWRFFCFWFFHESADIV